MSDYKQIITDENLVKYKSLKAVAIMCFVLAALMLIFSSNIPAAVMAIGGVCALFFRKYLKVSFEYEIKGQIFNVDKIIAGMSPKRLLSFNMQDMIVMAPETSKKLKEMNFNPDKTLKLYPKNYLKGVYILMLNSENKVLKVKIIPDKKLLELCRDFNKQKVIKE